MIFVLTYKRATIVIWLVARQYPAPMRLVNYDSGILMDLIVFIPETGF